MTSMDKIADQAKRFCQTENRSSIQAREIEEACKAVLPPKLFEAASLKAKKTLLESEDCDTDSIQLDSSELQLNTERKQEDGAKV